MTFALAAAAVAFSDPLPEPKEKIVAASLFKNGYAVVLREFELPGTGEFLLPAAPKATIGTYWMMPSDGVTVNSLVSGFVPTEGERDAGNIHEVVAQNVGKRMKLHMVLDGKPRDLIGTLKSLSQQLMVFEVDGKKLFLNSNGVTWLEEAGDELRLKVKTTGARQIVRVDAEGAKGSKVYTMALQKGASWAPSYAVDITEEGKVRLTSKATVVNDLDEFDSIEVKLITGFPNIAHLKQDDPFANPVYFGPAFEGLFNASRQAMLGYGGGGFGGGGFGGGGFANQATMMPDRRSSSNLDFSPSAGGFASGIGSGEAIGDLFFYSHPGVSLKKGERGYYMLFEKTTDAEHVFVCSLPDPVKQSGSNLVVQPVKELPTVWHMLEFMNRTGQPLTTAPAMVVQKGQVVGQDTIYYTPKGGPVSMRINKALDVRVESETEILSRVKSTVKYAYQNRFYDRATVEGTLHLKNLKDEDVTVRLKTAVVGQPVEADGDPEVRELPAAVNAINPSTEYVWEIVLPKRSEKVLTYSWKLLVTPRN
jgi:hypothetical protein